MKEIIKIKGQAVPVLGDDIDTDRIIPARYMKCLTFDGLGEYAFYDLRYHSDGSQKEHPLNRTEYRNHSILISNRNFGCGSSREHAPWALYGIGIRAIIAESFAEIFAGNCSSLGIPAVIVSSDICRQLQELVENKKETYLEINLENQTISTGTDVFPFTMPETYRQGLIRGQWDTTALLLESMEQIQKKHSELPAFSCLEREE